MDNTDINNLTQTSVDEITFYWRPGCPFCQMLEAAIAQTIPHLKLNKRNIWQDQTAASFVRSVADGNETVPTVTVGDTHLVNPNISDLVAAINS